MQQYPYNGQYSPIYLPPEAEDAVPALARKKARRTLRRHSNFVGLCLIASFLIQEMFFLMIHMFGLQDTYFNNTALSSSLGAIALSLIAFALPFMIYSFLSKGDAAIGRLPFSPPKKGSGVVWIVIIAFAFCLLANFAAYFAGEFMESIGITEIDTDPPVSKNAFEAVVGLLSSAVIPALLEEFIYRGVIMQPLRRYGEHFAVFTTAFMFALAHMKPTTMLFAFIVGVVIGYADVITDSIWPGMIIHLINNIYACVVTDVYGNFTELSDVYVNVFDAVIMALALVGVIVLIRKKSVKIKKSTDKKYGGARFAWYYLSVPLVIAYLYYGFYIFRFLKFS